MVGRREAGSDRGDGAVEGSGPAATLTVPADARAGDTIQVILEATDDGDMPLSRFEKVFLTVDR